MQISKIPVNIGHHNFLFLEMLISVQLITNVSGVLIKFLQP